MKVRASACEARHRAAAAAYDACIKFALDVMNLRDDHVPAMQASHAREADGSKSGLENRAIKHSSSTKYLQPTRAKPLPVVRPRWQMGRQIDGWALFGPQWAHERDSQKPD